MYTQPRLFKLHKANVDDIVNFANIISVRKGCNGVRSATENCKNVDI